MSPGVDIYRYQTVTDWHALAGAVSWAYVKLTDGAGPAVVRGDKQVNGCQSVNIPVGGYHYAQPGNPEQQAAVLLSEIRRLGAVDLAPALDLEAPFTPGSAAKDFGIRFCRAVAEAGYRPAVYMSASWAGTMRPDQWGIPGLVIWVAAYGTNSGAAYDPKRTPATVTRYYAGRYDIHQYTSTGRVAGISGVVDVNEALTDTHNTQERDMQADERDWLYRLYVAHMVTKDAPKRPDHDSPNETVHEALWANRDGIEDAQKLISDLQVGMQAAVRDAVLTYFAENPPQVQAIDYAAIAKAVNDDAARRGAE